MAGSVVEYVHPINDQSLVFLEIILLDENICIC